VFSDPSKHYNLLIYLDIYYTFTHLQETKVSQLMNSGTFWPFSVCRNHHSWEGTTSLSQVLCSPRVESELSPPEVFL